MSFVVTAGLGFIFLREALTIRKGFELVFAIVAITCLART
jgi:multidrug transporter EmrE-like cation transporter